MTDDETLERLDASIVVSCTLVLGPLPGWRKGQRLPAAQRCQRPAAWTGLCRTCQHRKLAQAPFVLCDEHYQHMIADPTPYTHSCGVSGPWAQLIEFLPLGSAA